MLIAGCIGAISDAGLPAQLKVGWVEAHNHGGAPSPTFNAIHASLIPKGPHRGKILAWGFGSGSGLDWALIDPVAGTEQTFSLPPPGGELFCSDHTWTRDGILIVSGGWVLTATPPVGSTVTYSFDPSTGPNGTWTLRTPLNKPRYYPSVIPSGNALDDIYIMGGGDELFTPAPTDIDDFQILKVNNLGGINQWYTFGPTSSPYYPGPSTAGANLLHRFWQYPRVFTLSDGSTAMTGMSTQASRTTIVSSTAPTWTPLGAYGSFNPAVGATFHEYGSAVRMPNYDASYNDTLAVLGGCDMLVTTIVPRADVQICNPTKFPVNQPWPNGYQWTPLASQAGAVAPLHHARCCFNAVLYPNGAILAVHGQEQEAVDPNPTFLDTDEWFYGGVWTDTYCPNPRSRRGYHCTALLLPDGRIWTAGGNSRDCDYEILVPPPLASGSRPQWSAPYPNENLGYNQSTTVNFTAPAGATVDKVVLMRPGSLTHHWDRDQRCVFLSTFSSQPPVAGSIGFTTPANSSMAPKGYYMLFLVSNSGVVSEARWVRLS